MIDVDAIQHLIWEFAGPWTFRQAMELALENVYQIEMWKVPLTFNLTGDWGMSMCVDSTYSRYHSRVDMKVRLYRDWDDTIDYDTIEYKITFFDTEEFITYVEEQLEDLLPKRVFLEHPIMVDSPNGGNIDEDGDPRTDDSDFTDDVGSAGCDVSFEVFRGYFE